MRRSWLLHNTEKSICTVQGEEGAQPVRYWRVRQGVAQVVPIYPQEQPHQQQPHQYQHEQQQRQDYYQQQQAHWAAAAAAAQQAAGQHALMQQAHMHMMQAMGGAAQAAAQQPQQPQQPPASQAPQQAAQPPQQRGAQAPQDATARGQAAEQQRPPQGERRCTVLPPSRLSLGTAGGACPWGRRPVLLMISLRRWIYVTIWNCARLIVPPICEYISCPPHRTPNTDKPHKTLNAQNSNHAVCRRARGLPPRHGRLAAWICPWRLWLPGRL